jgi:prepilin peptidase CpaA
MSNLIPASLLAFLMIAAATGDMLSYRIPNKLTLLIACLFLPAALLAGMPLPMLLFHVLAGGAVLLMGFLLFAIRVFGGGDAKLLAAASLWLGWPALLSLLVWTAMAGGLLGILFGIRALSDRYIRKAPARRAVPYDLAIASGTILALPYSFWMLPA